MYRRIATQVHAAADDPRFRIAPEAAFDRGRVGNPLDVDAETGREPTDGRRVDVGNRETGVCR